MLRGDLCSSGVIGNRNNCNLTLKRGRVHSHVCVLGILQLVYLDPEMIQQPWEWHMPHKISIMCLFETDECILVTQKWSIMLTILRIYGSTVFAQIWPYLSIYLSIYLHTPLKTASLIFFVTIPLLLVLSKKWQFP
jgi:hypothetical protein